MTGSRNSLDISLWINVLKGVAIFEIVTFHFFADHGATFLAALRGPSGASGVWVELQSLFVNLTRAGSQGIHIFFFMSGLGLALSESRGWSSPGTFLRRRVLRVYPTYAAALVVVSAAFLAVDMRQLGSEFVASFLAAALLIQNYSSQWIRAINGNWWFVAALLPMYLMHLLIRAQVARKPLMTLAFVYAVSFAYKLLVATSMHFGWIQVDAGNLNPYTAFFVNYWWEFVAGAAAARLFTWERIAQISCKGMTFMLAIALALEGVGIVLGTTASGRVFNDDFFTIAQILGLTSIALFLATLQDSGVVRSLFKVMATMGTYSYGLYLVHHPISRILLNTGWVAPNFLDLLAAFAAFFLIAWVIGRFTEHAGELVLVRGFVGQRS